MLGKTKWWYFMVIYHDAIHQNSQKTKTTTNPTSRCVQKYVRNPIKSNKSNLVWHHHSSIFKSHANLHLPLPLHCQGLADKRCVKAKNVLVNSSTNSPSKHVQHNRFFTKICPSLKLTATSDLKIEDIGRLYTFPLVKRPIKSRAMLYNFRECTQKLSQKSPHILHPWRLTGNIITEVWKLIFLCKLVICRFHVNLPGCKKNRLKIGKVCFEWSWKTAQIWKCLIAKSKMVRNPGKKKYNILG